ncbi:MAG: hypothetical protein KGZ35_05540 [Truepera sp.]|nr:hypothetical protein [Truepera sp.]
MIKAEPLALELLEYKVNDLLVGRQVRGGSAAVWALHDWLTASLINLDDNERSRLHKVSERLSRIGRAIGDKQVIKNLDELELGSEPPLAAKPARLEAALLSPAEFEEQQTLKRLARRVWWDDLERVLQRLAAGYRAERDRQTARLLYATLRNLARCARSDTFAQDVNLAHFQVVEPVPELTDPLVSITSADSVFELLRELATIALTFKQADSPYAALSLPEEQALSYLRRVALAVARDPFAGRRSLLSYKGPTSQQLRTALEALSRDQMREEARREERQRLEQRLSEALNFERTQQQLFERDVRLYTQAAETLFEQLGQHLPKRVGGSASDPQLPSAVLFAENPALRIESVPTSSQAVTIYLRGPVRLKLGGVELGIMRSGNVWSLYVADQQLPLQPRMSFKLGRRRLSLFHEGQYVHLRLQDEVRSLAALVAEALVLQTVLQPDRQAVLLNLLQTATGVAISEPQQMVRQAIARLQHMSDKTPDRRKALAGFLQGAARAARLNLDDELIDGLVERLYIAMTISEDGLGSLLMPLNERQGGVYPLSDEPLSLAFDGMPLTIRRYRSRGQGVPESIVVMLPGRPLGSFTDYLLAPFGTGTLLCARSSDALAAFYLPQHKIETVAS